MNRRTRPGGFMPLGVSCLLAITGAGLAAGENAGKPFIYHETEVLGTSLDLRVTALTQADADKVHQLVMEEVERLRKILSSYDTACELAQVNAAQAPVKVSKELIDVLKMYDHWQQVVGPAFSGRLGKISELWQQAAKEGKMPTAESVAAAAAMIHVPLWKIDDKAGTVQRTGDDTINVDSLGKGFIVSQAAEFARAGVPAARGLLLNIGGDIAALGSSSAAKVDDWTVDIADPDHPADNASPVTTLKLADMSVATSGGYERGYQVGKVKVSHIIDPRNGYPVDSTDAPIPRRGLLVASATVIARDNAAANALATSLCVLRPDEGSALIAALPGVESLVIMSDGTHIRSKGFARYETIAEALTGKGWEKGSEMNVTLQFAAAARERPYVAVWVENDQGDHVVTLAEWGNNQRFVNGLSEWFAFSIRDDSLLRAVSRATRPAGRYTFSWDGKDQRGIPMPKGVYKVSVELAYEHNGHTISTGTIDCGAAGATTTLPATKLFDAVTVTFNPPATLPAPATTATTGN